MENPIMSKWVTVYSVPSLEVNRHKENGWYRVVFCGRTRLFQKETAAHDADRFIRDMSFTHWAGYVANKKDEE